ncbi:gustatory receptor for sugar taste 64a-like [Uranotaenia lowii]|uniref:gustatory receptor for sugar taste 64a-like n=1 Tax=Uranotaenia lowii TaxID=190385 RepID=UPI00247AEF45|nr:gustatory receptor for sugar taste 64a-like [Uranotaenia lowii]
MVPAFVSFQMFGFFPVTGILGSKTSIDLNFRWWHPKTLFSVLIALLGMLMCYVEYRRVDRTGVNAGNLLGVVFYADTYCNVALTLTWTGMDLTIVLLSPFKDGFSIAREGFWIEIREQYVQVCCLVNKASELLAPMIIHSCATNIYLICYAFLTFTWAETGILAQVNHWFSLFFMIGKTVLMFYSASMVNETSKYPLKTCTAVPNIGWCIELDRFINQLRSHRVALSAMGFFDLTKRTMLALAGTIITFELVMLNFAKDTAHVGNVIPCSRLAFSRDD